MKNSTRGSILSVWILVLSLALPYAYSSDASYESLSDINEIEVFYLGDVLTIDAGWCTASKKPSQSYAKKRLEIYKSGKWISVGKVIYPKADSCPKKTPYLQQFQWEVDELGVMNPDQVSGKLRLRNTAVKPTIYSKISVFESEVSYQAKLKAEKAAAEKATVQRVGEYMDIFNCVVQGGEWNSQGKYCVLPKP